MPHATLPSTGFQALILCGPGESLAPFNANPNDFPKALVPIANRPMVWYPLEWCYRMGVTNITLVAPPSSHLALSTALSQNPHLTSLPSPRPTLLAPAELTLTTGTAELFRLPAVQNAISGDFIVLPCDIICELSGSTLLETWMTLQGGLGGVSAGDSVAPGLGGEKSGRRGGLGVWYQTKDSAEGGVGVKKEETDFLATTELPSLPAPASPGSLQPFVRNLALAMPTAVLQDELEEKKSLRVRHALLKKRGRVKMLMTHRDAHVYFFPYWVKEMMARDEHFESVGEDVLGWWAKAGWQDGLAEKLGLASLFGHERKEARKAQEGEEGLDEEVDLKSLSSTWTSEFRIGDHDNAPSIQEHTTSFASRVSNPPQPSSTPLPRSRTVIPPILSYIHPSHPPAPLIRRVDTVPLLLSVSIALAKLPSVADHQAASGSAPTSSSPLPSPFSHAHKIHPTTPLPPQLTLKPDTNLVDANVTLSSKSTIKDCIIGANCMLGAAGAANDPGAGTSQSSIPGPSKGGPSATGVRLNRTLLMEGAVIEAGCKLDGCVLGRRCRIGADCELRDCYVQEGFVVAAGTVAKGEVLAMGVDEEGFGGSSEGGDDEDMDEDGEEGTEEE